MGSKKFYFKPSLYNITVNEVANGFTHISISRKDRKPIVSTWDVLQAVKQSTVGDDRFAVEMYPSGDQLVFEENMRHLWVYPESERPDFGFFVR